MTTCAYCGKEILDGEPAYVCCDNWLLWNYYCDMPKSKNVYCSKECFADDWVVEEIEPDELEGR